MSPFMSKSLMSGKYKGTRRIIFVPALVVQRIENNNFAISLILFLKVSNVVDVWNVIPR